MNFLLLTFLLLLEVLASESAKCRIDYSCHVPVPNCSLEESNSVRVRDKSAALLVWLKDGFLQSTDGDESDFYHVNDSLLFPKTQFWNAGTYRCVNVVEKQYKERGSVRVEVFAPPLIVQVPPNFQRAVGHRAAMRCVAEGYPKPEISWLRNGIAIDKNDSDVKVRTIAAVPSRAVSTVSIAAVTMQYDQSLFQCIASNAHGSARTNITLRIFKGRSRTPLARPQRVRVVAVEHCTITLSWHIDDEEPTAFTVFVHRMPLAFNESQLSGDEEYDMIAMGVEPAMVLVLESEARSCTVRGLNATTFYMLAMRSYLATAISRLSAPVFATTEHCSTRTPTASHYEHNERHSVSKPFDWSRRHSPKPAPTNRMHYVYVALGASIPILLVALAVGCFILYREARSLAKANKSSVCSVIGQTLLDLLCCRRAVVAPPQTVSTAEQVQAAQAVQALLRTSPPAQPAVNEGVTACFLPRGQLPTIAED